MYHNRKKTKVFYKAVLIAAFISASGCKEKRPETVAPQQKPVEAVQVVPARAC